MSKHRLTCEDSAWEGSGSRWEDPGNAGFPTAPLALVRSGAHEPARPRTPPHRLRSVMSASSTPLDAPLASEPGPMPADLRERRVGRAGRVFPACLSHLRAYARACMGVRAGRERTNTFAITPRSRAGGLARRGLASLPSALSVVATVAVLGAGVAVPFVSPLQLSQCWQEARPAWCE